MALGLAVFGIGDLLLIPSSLPIVIVGFIVAGAGIPWAILDFGTAVQRQTPPELQGRVYSAAETMIGTPQTISIAVGAGLSTLVDYRMLLIVMTVVTVGCALHLGTRRPTTVGREADVPIGMDVDTEAEGVAP